MKHLKHRKQRADSPYISPTPCRKKCGPRPLAGRLLIAGAILLMLATCDFGARLITAERVGARGAIHRLSDYGSAMSASAVILTAATVGVDYLERVEERDNRGNRDNRANRDDRDDHGNRSNEK